MLWLYTAPQEISGCLKEWSLSKGVGYTSLFLIMEKNCSIIFILYYVGKYHVVQAGWWSQKCPLENGFSHWPCVKITRTACLDPGLSFSSSKFGVGLKSPFVTHFQVVLMILWSGAHTLSPRWPKKHCRDSCLAHSGLLHLRVILMSVGLSPQCPLMSVI